jgi:hypothetical protein
VSQQAAYFFSRINRDTYGNQKVTPYQVVLAHEFVVTASYNEASSFNDSSTVAAMGCLDSAVFVGCKWLA